MRKAPSDSNESLHTQYDQLLRDSIKLAKSFEGHEESEDQREYTADALNHLLDQRVDLLKKMEHLRTIEDAYPRVNVEEDAVRERVEATELIEQLLSGAKGVEQVKAAGKRMLGPEPQELTDEESDAFRVACADLAARYGYAFLSAGGNNVRLDKGDMRFSLKHFAFPDDAGIVPPSRISVLNAWRMDGRAGGGMRFEDGQLWDACTDPEMQKELDRVIALFK